MRSLPAFFYLQPRKSGPGGQKMESAQSVRSACQGSRSRSRDDGKRPTSSETGRVREVRDVLEGGRVFSVPQDRGLCGLRSAAASSKAGPVGIQARSDRNDRANG